MSEHELAAISRTPVCSLADLSGELLLGFISTCSPMVREFLLSKWLNCLSDKPV